MAGNKKVIRRKNRKRTSVFSVLVLLVLLALSAGMAVCMVKTELIPKEYIIAATAGTAVLSVCVFLLIRTGGFKPKTAVGIITAILLAVVIIYICVFCLQTLGYLKNLTSIASERSLIGIYVDNDDTAQSPSDLKDYDIGILCELDRDNTDKAIIKFEEELAFELNIIEYDNMPDLLEGFKNNVVGAILINEAYIDMIEEMEGYEYIASSVRELGYVVVETPREETDGSELIKTENNGYIFTVYISGIDTRSSDLLARSRSDVNLFATINTDTRQILLISTPRDYFIPLSISRGQKDKLTHAGLYGVQVSMDTLKMLYDTEIEYYFRCNFVGFADIIDVLGGITVYSPKDFVSHHGAYQFYEGYNECDGDKALCFARERYAFSDGDVQRQKDCQEVFRAVFEKVMSPEMLSSYSALLETIEPYFETSVPYDVIADIVRHQILTGGDWEIISYTVNGSGSFQKPWSMSMTVWVMKPDYETVEVAKDLLQRIRNNEVITQPVEDGE